MPAIASAPFCPSASFQRATNRLFAALLLGVQRLEEAGVLLLAHQAMLEDMLECWTWGDTEELDMILLMS